MLKSRKRFKKKLTRGFHPYGRRRTNQYAHKTSSIRSGTMNKRFKTREMSRMDFLNLFMLPSRRPVFVENNSKSADTKSSKSYGWTNKNFREDKYSNHTYYAKDQSSAENAHYDPDFHRKVEGLLNDVEEIRVSFKSFTESSKIDLQENVANLINKIDIISDESKSLLGTVNTLDSLISDRNKKTFDQIKQINDLVDKYYRDYINLNNVVNSMKDGIMHDVQKIIESNPVIKKVGQMDDIFAKIRSLNPENFVTTGDLSMKLTDFVSKDTYGGLKDKVDSILYSIRQNSESITANLTKIDSFDQKLNEKVSINDFIDYKSKQSLFKNEIIDRIENIEKVNKDEWNRDFNDDQIHKLSNSLIERNLFLSVDHLKHIEKARKVMMKTLENNINHKIDVTVKNLKDEIVLKTLDGARIQPQLILKSAKSILNVIDSDYESTEFYKNVDTRLSKLEIEGISSEERINQIEIRLLKLEKRLSNVESKSPPLDDHYKTRNDKFFDEGPDDDHGKRIGILEFKDEINDQTLKDLREYMKELNEKIIFITKDKIGELEKRMKTMNDSLAQYKGFMPTIQVHTDRIEELWEKVNKMKNTNDGLQNKLESISSTSKLTENLENVLSAQEILNLVRSELSDGQSGKAFKQYINHVIDLKQGVQFQNPRELDNTVTDAEVKINSIISTLSLLADCLNVENISQLSPENLQQFEIAHRDKFGFVYKILTFMYSNTSKLYQVHDQLKGLSKVTSKRLVDIQSQVNTLSNDFFLQKNEILSLKASIEERLREIEIKLSHLSEKERKATKSIETMFEFKKIVDEKMINTSAGTDVAVEEVLKNEEDIGVDHSYEFKFFVVRLSLLAWYARLVYEVQNGTEVVITWDDGEGKPMQRPFIPNQESDAMYSFIEAYLRFNNLENDAVYFLPLLTSLYPQCASLADDFIKVAESHCPFLFYESNTDLIERSSMDSTFKRLRIKVKENDEVSASMFKRMNFIFKYIFNFAKIDILVSAFEKKSGLDFGDKTDVEFKSWLPISLHNEQENRKNLSPVQALMLKIKNQNTIEEMEHVIIEFKNEWKEKNDVISAHVNNMGDNYYIFLIRSLEQLEVEFKTRFYNVSDVSESISKTAAHSKYIRNLMEEFNVIDHSLEHTMRVEGIELDYIYAEMKDEYDKSTKIMNEVIDNGKPFYKVKVSNEVINDETVQSQKLEKNKIISSRLDPKKIDYKYIKKKRSRQQMEEAARFVVKNYSDLINPLKKFKGVDSSKIKTCRYAINRESITPQIRIATGIY